MRCRKQVARKGGRCRVLRSSLGSTIDWYPKIRWGGSGLAAVALRLKLQRLQPRLLEHQSAIAHWLSPAFSLFAPVEIVGALGVGFNLPVDANQIIQPAARLNYSRAELPLPTPLRAHGPEPCASANSATSASDSDAVSGRFPGKDCKGYSTEVSLPVKPGE